jgi:hypothetical protein
MCVSGRLFAVPKKKQFSPNFGTLIKLLHQTAYAQRKFAKAVAKRRKKPERFCEGPFTAREWDAVKNKAPLTDIPLPLPFDN